MSDMPPTSPQLPEPPPAPETYAPSGYAYAPPNMPTNPYGGQEALYPQKMPPGDGLAATSLALGLVSLAASLVWGAGAFISIPAGIVAIALGVRALKRNQSRSMTIWGIVTGAVGTFLSTLFTVILLVVVGGLGSTGFFDFGVNDSGFSPSTGKYDVTLIVDAPAGTEVVFKRGGDVEETVKVDSSQSWDYSTEAEFGEYIAVEVGNKDSKEPLYCEIQSGEPLSTSTGVGMVSCEAQIGITKGISYEDEITTIGLSAIAPEGGKVVLSQTGSADQEFIVGSSGRWTHEYTSEDWTDPFITVFDGSDKESLEVSCSTWVDDIAATFNEKGKDEISCMTYPGQ